MWYVSEFNSRIEGNWSSSFFTCGRCWCSGVFSRSWKCKSFMDYPLGCSVWPPVGVGRWNPSWDTILFEGALRWMGYFVRLAFHARCHPNSKKQFLLCEGEPTWGRILFFGGSGETGPRCNWWSLAWSCQYKSLAPLPWSSRQLWGRECLFPRLDEGGISQQSETSRLELQCALVVA